MYDIIYQINMCVFLDRLRVKIGAMLQMISIAYLALHICSCMPLSD